MGKPQAMSIMNIESTGARQRREVETKRTLASVYRRGADSARMFIGGGGGFSYNYEMKP